MSRIADSLVSKYKQYQALQKLIHAEKPSRTTATTNTANNGTTPDYSQLLTFNLAEYINANTSPPPPSPSPLETIRLSLLHKSPLNERPPTPGSSGGVGDEKIRELALRIIAMKKSEIRRTTTDSTEPARRETEWTPVADHSQIRRNHRADYNTADQYVEIYTKDKLTRLSTHAQKNNTNIVYAKSALS